MEKYTLDKASQEAKAMQNRLSKENASQDGKYSKEQYEEAHRNETDEIYKTAMGTVRDLSVYTDIEKAKEIWNLMGGEEGNVGFTEKASGKPHLVELRYKSSDKILRDLSKNEGIEQAVEIASGFTPHAIELLEAGVMKKYVESDLPVNTEKKREINHALNPDLPIDYVPGNIFEQAAWEKINASLNSGPVVIFSEGFMLYTSKNERELLANYVRPILEAHGGYFVFEDSTRFHPEFIKYPGFRPFFEKLAQSSQRDMGAVSQEDMMREWLDRGFKVERIAEDLSLSSESKLPALKEEIELIKANYKMWKLSLEK